MQNKKDKWLRVNEPITNAINPLQGLEGLETALTQKRHLLRNATNYGAIKTPTVSPFNLVPTNLPLSAALSCLAAAHLAQVKTTVAQNYAETSEVCSANTKCNGLETVGFKRHSKSKGVT